MDGRSGQPRDEDEVEVRISLRKITVLVKGEALSFWFLHTSAFLKSSSRNRDTDHCPKSLLCSTVKDTVDAMDDDSLGLQRLEM